MHQPKLGNIRVRAKDLKQGKTIYLGHNSPYTTKGAVLTMHVLSKPYFNKKANRLVILGTQFYNKDLTREYALSNMGVLSGDSENEMRAFFKYKHAEAYARGKYGLHTKPIRFAK